VSEFGSTSGDLVRRFQDGSDTAAACIHERYIRRLIALARKRLSSRIAIRIDPDDVVQSAFRSFFVHAREGAYVFERAGDLWRLLAQMTLNKLRGQVEYHSAQRRSQARETPIDPHSDQLASLEPSSEEIVEVIDLLQMIMHKLTPQQRIALQLRLQGKSTEDIAEELGRSQRTVRRLLKEVEWMISSEMRDQP